MPIDIFGSGDMCGPPTSTYETEWELSQRLEREYMTNLNRNVPEPDRLGRGARLVRLDFNPSENSKVDQIKATSAFLIDLIASVDAESDSNRHKALAITHVETASMFAVKAVTDDISRTVNDTIDE